MRQKQRLGGGEIQYDASWGKGLITNELKLAVALKQIPLLFGFMCH